MDGDDPGGLDIPLRCIFMPSWPATSHIQTLALIFLMKKEGNIEDEFKKMREKNSAFDYSIDVEDARLKRYAGLTSIQLDLAFVRDSLRHLAEIKDKSNQTIRRSLFISSIITYGRCFTQTRGRGTRLESTKYIKPQYKELHGEVMNLRHEYIAHAGVSDGEKFYATVYFNIIPESNEAELRLGYEGFGQIGFSDKQIEVFLALIDDLTTTLKAKTRDAAKAYLASLTADEKNNLLRKAVRKKNER